MKFKYKEFDDGILRPVIPVHFIAGEKKVYLDVLVDSGADLSFLPAEMGEVLGLDTVSGRPGRFIGITGGEEKHFIHEIEIAVGGHRFSTQVAFSHGLSIQSMGVVGQYGFFDLFIVRFDLLKEEIELKPRK